VPYLQLGLNQELGAVSFNSTTYPGTCKPSDLSTLAIFKNLQAQLNRVATGYNALLGHSVPLVSVDGDIGPGTMQMFEQVQAWLTADTSSSGYATAAMIMQQDTSSCSAVASNAEALVPALQSVADSLSVPASISQPSSGSSGLVSSSGKTTTVHTPTPANSSIATSLTDMVAGLDTTTLLLIAAGAGAFIYFTGRPRKAKGSKRPSRRRRSSITIYR